MCTDEQWTPRRPTQTMMISNYWIEPSSRGMPSDALQKVKGMFSFWLTPLDVPRDVKDYKFSFPSHKNNPCTTHMPAKLK